MQDLTYLHQHKYAHLVRSWLDSALQFEAAVNAPLTDYCSPEQPADPDGRDLMLAYNDNSHFLQYAQQLRPMLDDISLGVRQRY